MGNGMTSRERDRILRQLQTELREAQERRVAASQKFENVIREVPSAVEHSDSTARIHAASREYSLAVQEVTKALIKLNHFAIHGSLPEEPPEP